MSFAEQIIKKKSNSNNYKKGRTMPIKYIVIHYTANKGDTAKNNATYFANNIVKASANYFIDEDTIYESVPPTDTAYHCGGGLQSNRGHAWFGLCKNSNSIGIEMCMLDKYGNVRYGVINHCIKFTRYLMDLYHVPIANVIRHFDVTGKMCPAPFVEHEGEWKKFKDELECFSSEDTSKNEEDFDMTVLKSLVDKYGEDEVKGAIEALIKMRQEDEWKIAGSDYLHAECDFTDTHSQNEPITFGFLGTILSKFRKIN